MHSEVTFCISHVNLPVLLVMRCYITPPNTRLLFDLKCFTALMRWKNIDFINMTYPYSTTQSHSVANWLYTVCYVAEWNMKKNSEKWDFSKACSNRCLKHPTYLYFKHWGSRKVTPQTEINTESALSLGGVQWRHLVAVIRENYSQPNKGCVRWI